MNDYISLKSAQNFILAFEDYCTTKGTNIKSLKMTDHNIFFEFFNTLEFKRAYFDLSNELIKILSLEKENFLIQKTPTPRIHAPGSNGADIHCDYWYGHGLETKTIWMPLANIKIGNTIRVLNKDDGDKLLKDIENNSRLIDDSDTLYNKSSFDVLPELGSVYIFDSKKLHYSVTNNTKLTRISIDFRIANLHDKSSNKNLSDYYKIDKKLFFTNSKNNTFKKCLKYICGGKNKDTLLQHLIINNYAKRNNITIMDQEAEIERLDYPMIRKHLFSDDLVRNYDCIAIASNSIIPEILSELKNIKPKVKIILCMEDKVI